MYALSSCLRYWGVRFQASSNKQHELWDGTSLGGINTCLREGFIIDRINIAYTLMHPEARKETSDDMCYFNNASLPFIDETTLVFFLDMLKKPFVSTDKEFTMDHYFFRDHPDYFPSTCAKGTCPADTPGVGNPRIKVKLGMDMKDAAALADAMEQIGYSQVPKNEEIVSDIRKALKIIADYKPESQ